MTETDRFDHLFHHSYLNLQRQVTREDVDVDINSMHKELENLKDFMSGQITLEPSLISR